MSGQFVTYIRCAAGNNLQADCAVYRYGDLIRLFGHPEMIFTAQDAAKLGQAFLELARQCGWNDPEIDDCK